MTASVRIGLVSDSHDTFSKDWPSVVAAITEAFAGVDAILHCGDISTLEAIDALAAIAPVQATRSDGDPPAQPPRLQDGPAVVEVGDHRVGLAFARPESAEAFGQASGIEAVVFGGTHAASVEEVDGLLWVNPGSPSLAEHRSVAILTLAADARPVAEVIPLA